MDALLSAFNIMGISIVYAKKSISTDQQKWKYQQLFASTVYVGFLNIVS